MWASGSSGGGGCGMNRIKREGRRMARSMIRRKKWMWNLFLRIIAEVSEEGKGGGLWG